MPPQFHSRCIVSRAESKTSGCICRSGEARGQGFLASCPAPLILSRMSYFRCCWSRHRFSCSKLSPTSSSNVIVFKSLTDPSSRAPRSEKSNQEEIEVLMTMLAGLADPVEARSSPFKSKRLVSIFYKQPPRWLLFSFMISFSRLVTLSTFNISN